MASFTLGGTRRINWDPAEFVEEQEEVGATPSPSVPVQVPTKCVTNVTTPNNPVRVPVYSGTGTRVDVPPTPSGRFFPQRDPSSIRRRNRVGNGHKSDKQIDLIDDDRAIMKREFQESNGQLPLGDCSRILALLRPRIAPFQVVGYISYLHRAVASGLTRLRDLETYLQWMREKYPRGWEQYNSDRYINLRQRNDVARQSGRRMETLPIREAPLVLFSTQPVLSAVPRQSVSVRGV